MKKLVKMTSLIAMAGVVLLSSGCSCGLKKSKVNERSQATMESSLDYEKNFTITSKVNQTQGEDIKEYVYVMTRDADKDSVEYKATLKTGKEGEELVENTSFEEYIKFYKESGVVYLVVNQSSPIATDYISVYYAAIDTAALASNRMIKYDYHKFLGASYDKYKITPYHACAEGGDKKQVPEIFEIMIGRTLTCKAKRKLFGKETTYTIGYSVNVTEMRNLVIKTDKNNKLISIVETNNIAVAGQDQIKEVIEFTVQ